MATSNLFDFSVKSLQRSPILEGIKKVLDARKSALRIGNEKDARVFFCNVMEYIMSHESFGKYTNYQKLREGFARYGIVDGLTLMLEMDEKRELLVEHGYKMEWIKNPEDLLKRYNIVRVGNHTIDADETRTIVVRSKYGNYPVLQYRYYGPVCDCPQMTAIKIDYHYQTGCKFFETRPILYSTWMGLPPEQQNATCMIDGTDMEEEIA